MGKRFSIFVLVLLLAGSAWSARWWAQLETGYQFGETEYIYDDTGVDDQGRSIKVKSLLEFPLDVALLGIRGEALWGSGKNSVVVDAFVRFSLNDPGGKMYDHDWITWPESGFEGKFSYTESGVSMSSFQAGAGVRWYPWLLGSLQVGFAGGFQLQRASQDVTGFDGWQINFERPPFTKQALSDGRLGIKYRVTYLQGLAGLACQLSGGSPFSGDLATHFVSGYWSDYDDHVLRKKDAEADGFVMGVDIKSRMRVSLASDSSRVRPFVRLGGEFAYLHGTGLQTQTWYGDDAATEGDDTGRVSRDLPHEVNSTQYRIVLDLGIAF